jgi:hypothetical protein
MTTTDKSRKEVIETYGRIKNRPDKYSNEYEDVLVGNMFVLLIVVGETYTIKDVYHRLSKTMWDTVRRINHGY